MLKSADQQVMLAVFLAGMRCAIGAVVYTRHDDVQLITPVTVRWHQFQPVGTKGVRLSSVTDMRNDSHLHKLPQSKQRTSWWCTPITDINMQMIIATAGFIPQDYQIC